MNKKERFNLFELSLIDGITKFNFLYNSINAFLSDNFESNLPQKNPLTKFPISQKKINSAKKKSNNTDKKKFGKNREILNEMKKTFKRKNNLFYKSPNNSQLELTNLSNELKKSSSSQFRTLDKNKNENKINLDNESNLNNIELLSFESSQDLYLRSPKNSILNNPNFILPKNTINHHRVKSSYLIHHKNIDDNNIQSLSFSNFISSRINHINKKDKKNTDPQSPSSTRIKTRIKNVSFKSDNDNINDSISEEKKRSRLKKVKSAFSLDAKDNINNKSYISYLSDEKFNTSNYFSYDDRKEIRQKIKLKSLLYQIDQAKKKNIFTPNYQNNRIGFNSLKKFKRNLFLKKIKSASKKNLFFFKYPFQINKFVRLSKKNKTNLMPHQNILNDKSKNLLKNLEKLQINNKKERREIKANNKDIEIKNLRYFIAKTRDKKDFDKKVDELFKKAAVKYQGTLGKFFIHRGNGIFSGHLNALLKGDKIPNQFVKLENL